MILGALVLLGCKPSAPPAEPSVAPPASGPNAVEPSAGSPASAHCVEQGGKSELVDGAHGKGSVCVFGDGSRCEEFRFLRGQCMPASCFEPDGICDA